MKPRPPVAEQTLPEARQHHTESPAVPPLITSGRSSITPPFHLAALQPELKPAIQGPLLPVAESASDDSNATSPCDEPSSTAPAADDDDCAKGKGEELFHDVSRGWLGPATIFSRAATPSIIPEPESEMNVLAHSIADARRVLAYTIDNAGR